ncbi:MAG TPA: porin [Polyangia bacterium]|nr:porin [Polyangia bacterium]
MLALAGSASAEKILLKSDGWEVFTDGRVAGFISQVNGDGDLAGGPGTYVVTYPDGMMYRDTVEGGGFPLVTTNGNTGANPVVQGTANQTRIRSGFLGNQFNFGVRGQVTPYTTITGYISIWAFIESISQAKGNVNPADVRQGYAKLEGPWGSFLAGRTRTLFSRGATDIDVLYAHKWGVGFPSSIDSNGPTQGQVGFGVMGSGFGAAMIYGTPVLGGFHLNVGAFDPVQLSGGGFTRTGYPRAEAEATFERTFGNSGKIVLFVNGLYQKVYKGSPCVATATAPCDTTAAGVGYGGRLELGFFHLGLAGHYGQGLGLSYALENSLAAFDAQGNPRKIDGYLAQSQFVLGRFDLFAGWGITRVFLTTLDKVPAPVDTAPNSVIKYQMGTNAGVVYNMTPNVHFDLEYFRAQAAWYLGEHQILNTGAFGMTFNW